MNAQMGQGKAILQVEASKETEHYRIVTDDPENWHVVANRSFSTGECILPDGSDFLVDVKNAEWVELILKETGESKRIDPLIYAVPGDTGCALTKLEIPWCFMNHSCGPNTRDVWNPDLSLDLDNAVTTATCAIAKGEELTVDYNVEYFYLHSPFQCRCGKDDCIGFINGFAGLSSEHKNGRIQWISPFLREKIENSDSVDVCSPKPTGRHLILDYWQCDVGALQSEAHIVESLTRAARSAGASIISTDSHQFESQGVTAVLILAESHISVHTWPESGYAAADIFTCGGADPFAAHEILEEALGAKKFYSQEVTRGTDGISSSVSPREESIQEGLQEADSWFTEELVPGQAEGDVQIKFRVSESVIRKKTSFQECFIFENPVYGRICVLDGIVQLSTRDEYIYHEMLVHPVMMGHPDPKRVCIVGGGDGGALREVLKHQPDSVELIDIDDEFVRLARTHLPSVSSGAFNDSRVSLRFEDASIALSRIKNEYDVIIVDCSDPVGPSETLFYQRFYEMVKQALRPQGLCSFQVGSMLQPELLGQTHMRLGSTFGQIAAYRFSIPCFHCGEYYIITAGEKSGGLGLTEIELAERARERDIVANYWNAGLQMSSWMPSMPGGVGR